jgi:preprotein translocase subunit SecA
MRRFAGDRMQGLMRTLGFNDEVALESKTVSKTIESAQSRVEGYNFDTRKHVVEYDDVINRQRETIYRERDRILRSEDLSSTMEAMLEDEVRSLTAEHTVGDHPDDWNRDGLKAQLTTMIPNLGPADLARVDEANDQMVLADSLVELANEHYAAKRGESGDDGMRVLERLVLLRVIDSLWVEHLTAIDDMRRGIGLRAYSQRDPLNEFKIEAYRMFDELKATIRHDVTHTIFRVTVVREQAGRPQPTIESRPEIGPGAPLGDGPMAAGNGDGATPRPAKSGPKIGRNDPCFCGSGKKFKRCHGA